MLVNFILLNLINSIVIMLGLYYNEVMAVLIGFYFKIGVFGFNNWIMGITRRLNLVSIYVISICVKAVYILIFLRYNVLLRGLGLYLILGSIGMVSIWSLLRVDIKSILMIGSIALFCLFLLISANLYSYVYIVLYLIGSIGVIMCIIEYNLLLFMISIFNMLSIRPTAGFLIKLNYFKILLEFKNVWVLMAIMTVYLLNIYLYIRLLYNCLIAKNNRVYSLGNKRMYLLYNFLIFLYLM